MKDNAVILAALNQAAFIIADHFEPELPGCDDRHG